MSSLRNAGLVARLGPFDEDHGLRLFKADPADAEQFQRLATPAKFQAPGYVLSFREKQHGSVFSKNAIVGWLKQTPTINKKTDLVNIEVSNFIENPGFDAVLQKVIGSSVYDSASDVERARVAKNGWLHIPDLRNHLALVRTIPEEIIGSVLVENGVMVKGTYAPMELHRLVTADGMFRLEPFLHSKLLQALASDR